MKEQSQILSRVIGQKTDNSEWLSIFSKGLNLLDGYDHEQLDAKGLTTKKRLNVI